MTDGSRVMLALAFVKEQQQDIKVHRPEVCYPSQGMSVEKYLVVQSNWDKALPIVRLHTRSHGRLELVSYWIRTGQAYPITGLETRWQLFKDGLRGVIDDGMLVRVSTIVNDRDNIDQTFERQETFLRDLVLSVDPQKRHYLVAGEQ